MQMIPSAEATGHGDCEASKTTGERTFVTRVAFTHAATLCSASGSRSEGWKTRTREISRKINDVLARAACDFEDDALRRQDIPKDTENEIANAQCCRSILAGVVHHPQAFPELGTQNSPLGKSRRNRRMSAHWCCQRPRVSASQLLQCSASFRRMHEPCRVAQSLPTPDTIMLRTTRCSACCDRRGDQGGDRSRPHAAARGGIERIRPNIFDGGNAEGVDRRLGDDEARKSRPLWRQTEQRFRAAGQRALVGRFAMSTCVTAPASLPLPLPQTARRLRCKGARDARELLRRTLAARPALA